MSTETPVLAGYNYYHAKGTAERCLLLFHGTGGDGESMMELGRLLDAEAQLFSVEGRVLEGSARRFFARHDEGVFDMADVERRTDELAEFIGQLKAAYTIDHNNLIGVGYSNGANILASLLLHKPQSIKAGILFRSLFPGPPATIAHLTGASVLMLNGIHDRLVSADQAERLKDVFGQRGAAIDLAMVEAGHELSQADILVAREWLEARG